mgnify:CR=1
PLLSRPFFDDPPAFFVAIRLSYFFTIFFFGAVSLVAVFFGEAFLASDDLASSIILPSLDKILVIWIFECR